MTNNNNTDKASTLQEFIERIVVDEEFKENFLNNPDEAMEGWDLTDAQKLLLKSLDPEDVAKLTPENVEEYFSADSAVYTPDMDEDMGDEENQGEEDDIL